MDKITMENKILELEAKIKALEADSTIPYDVEQAFRGRLQISSTITSSAKGATSETIAVNSATATLVQLAPDAFLQVTVGGGVKYIPIYT